MRSARWLIPLAALLLAGCGSRPDNSDRASGPPASDPLAAVAWPAHVRDCSTANGGPGLGTAIESVAKGDATRDGKVDTFVVDECRSSTSSWPEVVEVFDGASDPGEPTRIATLLDGDEHYPRGLTVAVRPDGQVVVTGTGLSASAPHCCPDLAVRDVFRYDGGRFVRVEHAETPAPARS